LQLLIRNQTKEDITHKTLTKTTKTTVSGQFSQLLKWSFNLQRWNKMVHFYFMITLKNWTKCHIFFTVKFRKDLREKLELKLSPPLKPVIALPCEMQVVNYTALQHSSKW